VLQGTLDPALLDAAGVDIVIWHKTGGEPAERLGALARQQLGAPTYEDARIALFEVPPADPPPEFAAQHPSELLVADEAKAYFYAPTAGWVEFAATLQAEGRTVELYLNDGRVHRWQVAGEISVRVPLPITRSDFYTARLALDPACPRLDNPILTCEALYLSNLRLQNFTPDPLLADRQPVRFERGARLESAWLNPAARPGEPLPLWLWWRFDRPLRANDIRFVHVLDSSGQPIVQADNALGIDQANTQWVETPLILLPASLPPGVYRVYVGWYSYPDLTRFAVLSDTPDAVNRLALVGTFEIPASPEE
jgi:hypothetical protein